jgi:manganese efflux pump family protein
LGLPAILGLAFALGFDAFAVGIAAGVKLGKLDRWTVFRLSFHFGFAQFGMPIVGFTAGEYLFKVIGHWGDWIAALILFGIGAHIIWQQIFPDKLQFKGDPTRGASLLMLMFATSVDALAAGISLALIGVDIVRPSILIGVVAAGMTIIGLVFGRLLGIRFSRVAGFIGGLLLIGLAIKTAM